MSPEEKPTTEESQRGEKFDEEITDGNGRAAVFAFAAQIDPRNQWNIQVEGYGVFAVGTMGWRRDDTLSKWQSMNADIEKAPHDGAQDEHNGGPEVERDDGPVLRIEDGLKHGDARGGGASVSANRPQANG